MTFADICLGPSTWLSQRLSNIKFRLEVVNPRVSQQQISSGGLGPSASGPFMIHLGALVRYALAPTLAALVWCAFLFHLRHAVLAGESAENVCRWWKDLDWAASRVLASLGTVTGMLLAFRSNSALDRWATGRRKWSDVQATSRSLLRLLASALLVQSPGKTIGQVDEAIAIVPFFTICLMHQLRGQSIQLGSSSRAGLLRRDLLDQVPAQLTGLAQRSRTVHSADSQGSSKLSESEREKQSLNDDSLRQLRSRSSMSTANDGSVASSNLALATLVYLQRLLDRFHSSSDQPTLAGPVYAHCIGLVNSLSSHMTELERVRDTPVPLSVSRHFSRLLLIHSAMLPFILVQRLGDRLALCLGITGVVTGMLYGVDSFAAILGQPFGTDKEDLPLERFVAEAQREWIEVRASASLFTVNNPFRTRREVTPVLSATDDHASEQATAADEAETATILSHNNAQPPSTHEDQHSEPDDMDPALADEDSLRDTFTF